MAKKKLGVGIRGNAFMAQISGAKVLFDPRTTAEVCESRDDKNYKSAERLFRKQAWEEALREQQRNRVA